MSNVSETPFRQLTWRLRTPIRGIGDDFWAWEPEKHFLDKGLHNPTSTSRDVHNQLLQTKAGSDTQETKVKTRFID
jgi:hypothetical protein